MGRHPLLVFIAGFGMAAGLIGCAARSNTRSVTPSGPGADRGVVEELIHFQREALALASTCERKTSRQELQTFCQDLAKDHGRVAATLSAWFAQWYPSATLQGSAGHSSEQFRGFEETMQSATGAAFEEAFLRGIRIHHRQGSQLTQQCSDSAQHDELKLFCVAETEKQQNELKQISGWICQWFRDCLD